MNRSLDSALGGGGVAALRMTSAGRNRGCRCLTTGATTLRTIREG